MKRFLIMLLVVFLITAHSYTVQAFQTNKIKTVANQVDTLKSEEMHFEMTAMDIDDINNSPAIKLYVDFNWNSDPFWTLTDTITVSWSSGWRLNTSYLEVTHLLSNGTEKTKTFNPIEQAPNHIIWDYDLQKAADVYGRAVIILVPEDTKKISPVSFSSADVQYAHEARTITLKPVTFTSTRSVSWNNADILD
jgi:hypothetical protein